MKIEHITISVGTVSLLALGGAAVQGCSTACTDCTGGPPQPSWPSGWEQNGEVVVCRLAGEPDPTTGAGPSEGVTCISRQSIRREHDHDCKNHRLRNTYIKAICAKTFGGVPSDYSPGQGDWGGLLDSYPTSGINDQGRCDVLHSFSETDEVPVATDAVLLSTGEYDRCSRDSYCETLAAIIDEFPGDGIEPNPWCNVSPGGDSQEPGPWRCVGSSTYGPDGACGKAILPAYAPNDGPACPVVEPGGREYCVIASSETEASEKCRDVCAKADTAFEANLGISYTEDLECTVFDSNAMLWVENVISECYNADYEINNASQPFSFTVELEIDGGARASSYDDANLGFIDYRVDNCVGLNCDITVEGLELSYMEYRGTFSDDQHNPHPFSVDGVSIHLVEPVRGTVRSRPSGPPEVEFPSQFFELALLTGDVTIDAVSLGPVGPITIPVTQVTGTYSGGSLALEIVYETVDATMALTLTTF